MQSAGKKIRSTVDNIIIINAINIKTKTRSQKHIPTFY